MSRQCGEIHRRREGDRNRRRSIGHRVVVRQSAHDAGNHGRDTVAIAVAGRSAHCAGRSRGSRCIRRHTHRAGIGRAFVAVVENIRIVIDGLRPTHAVALILLAVSHRLHGRGCADRCIVEPAATHRTSTGLAERIHSWTIRGRETLHTRSGAIAQCAALRTRRSRSGGRIRRRTGGADVVGALIHVDGNVGVVHGIRVDVAHAVALRGPAIARHRIRDDRTVGCVVGAAHIHVACAGLARRIGTALARHVALHALSSRIAEGAAARRTGGIDRLGRMYGHARATRIVRTLITVVRRHVGIVRNRDDDAHAIALHDLTVAGRLTHRHGRAIGLIIEAANSAGTGTGLAFRIHSRTLTGHHALRRRNTHAIAVTLRTPTLVTPRSCWQVRMRRHSSRAHFTRALIAIVHRDVVVVDHSRRDAAHAIALVRATITYGRIAGHRSHRGIIEPAHRARARTGLAYRIHSGTIHRHVTLHARARRIADRATTVHAHGPRSHRRMRHARHRIARIRRARIVVRRRNGILHGPLRHVARRHGTRIAIISGQVGTIKRVAHVAHTVTNRRLAIVHRLRLENRTLRSKGETAHAARTCTSLAFRIISGAIRGLVATNAIAHSIANEPGARAARRAHHERRIRRHAVGTRIVRTIIVINRDVGVIIHGLDLARTIALIDFAIFVRLPHGRRRSGSRERRPTDVSIARCNHAFIRRCGAIRGGLARHTATGTASAAHSAGARCTTCASHAAGTARATCASHAAATAAAAAAGRVPRIDRVIDLRSVNLREYLAPRSHRAQRERGCCNEKIVRPAHRSVL